MVPLRPAFLYPYPVVQASKESKLKVLCDWVTDGGGWVIIQRRTDGDVDFYQGWDAYKEGFGSLMGDFWLGNENIHALTSDGTYELRVELGYKEKKGFAHYKNFSLGGEEGNYILRVGSYDGTAGDFLAYHNGRPFTTHDRDNDSHGRNCAVLYTGAWWYGSCDHSSLNGKWGATSYRGPRWGSFTVRGDPVTFSEMKIRRME